MGMAAAIHGCKFDIPTSILMYERCLFSRGPLMFEDSNSVVAIEDVVSYND